MSEYELSTVLALIDEWVDQLEDWELSGQCRKAGRDFFSFMKDRSVE
ncbi:hypothetical protein [Thermoleptolyngbya sp.]|jgi:hypothetical protein